MAVEEGLAVAERAGSLAHLAGKHLTFRLAAEEYGLAILQVREIIGLMDITMIPRTPHFVRGVINLRGKVIPVIDLRAKFGMPATEDTAQTCIIVVEVHHGASTLPMGVVVDEVSEVRDIPGDQIDPTPAFGSAVDTGFILGIGKIGAEVIMLLDLDQVLDADELTLVDKIGR